MITNDVMKKMKEVDAKLIKKIIENIAFFEEEKEKIFFKENHCYYSKLENDSIRWDYDAYIRRMKSLIHEYELDNYFEFNLIKKPETIQENGFEYFVKYKISIKNLKIICVSEQFQFESLIINERFPKNSKLLKDEYKGGIYVEFFNCEFINQKTNYNASVRIVLGGNGRIIFNDNIFNDV